MRLPSIGSAPRARMRQAPSRKIHNANPVKGSDAVARKSKAPVLAASSGKTPRTKCRSDETASCGWANSSGDKGSIPPAWLPQPKEITLIDDRLALLHKVLDQLPKPQRQALELAVFGGLSESEIAAEMGEPLGKVRNGPCGPR